MTQSRTPPSLPLVSFANALISRHFGAIVLSGGHHGGHTEETLSLAGYTLLARLEIDDPVHVKEHELANLDLALDSFDRLDRLARDAVSDGLDRGNSASSQLYEAWGTDLRDKDSSSERREFVEALTPVSIVARMDGVRTNEERMRIEYVLPTQREEGKLAILFVDGIGAELASSLRR